MGEAEGSSLIHGTRASQSAACLDSKTFCSKNKPDQCRSFRSIKPYNPLVFRHISQLYPNFTFLEENIKDFEKVANSLDRSQFIDLNLNHCLGSHCSHCSHCNLIKHKSSFAICKL